LTTREAETWRRRWDRQQERYVWDREWRFRSMLLWLRATVGTRPRCLDLGCGTGAVTERVLAELPRARVVAVDFDPVTRTLGEVALRRYRSRVTWVDADLRSADWVHGLPDGRYDAALSSTALHWLRERELTRLYRQLATRIRPGGVFLNADGIAFDATSPRIRESWDRVRATVQRRAPGRSARRGDAWKKWWREVARVPALQEEVRLHRARFPHEHLGTRTADLGGHVRRLRAAGFREVDLVYSRGTSRILAAVR
jgi:SAM-dependent methyltransferase